MAYEMFAGKATIVQGFSCLPLTWYMASAVSTDLAFLAGCFCNCYLMRKPWVRSVTRQLFGRAVWYEAVVPVYDQATANEAGL